MEKQQQKTILIMAGGTGGHIMPGLAVAHELEQRGWHVLWLGNPQKMEGRLVPEHGIELKPMVFAGLRGKGLVSLLKLPFTLAKACHQANRVYKENKIHVVLGMGGYVAVPGGLMAKFNKVPLVIHEQNARAGTANKWLAKLASRCLSGFPNVLPHAIMVGNPVRQDVLNLKSPQERYNLNPQRRLKLLIVGGSLGALALNQLVPQALALLPEDQRPEVTHQSGKQHIQALQAFYQELGVQAHCVDFIEDMASALAQADFMICRAGAMTIAEVAAAGVAALFVPLPGAIDDHQTANARWLADQQAAWVMPQAQITPQRLAHWISEQTPATLQATAIKARTMALTDATQKIADHCEDVAQKD